MPKISPLLQSQIDAVGPSAHNPYRVIVILEQNADWEVETRLLEDAGLEISSHEELVGVVFGVATADVIARLATLPSVGFIEPDEDQDVESDASGVA